ncbi:GCS-domain-containing protein [Microthyrium microscopicum]|uniref:Glutamate--cysteine ligase n=1 Tax=Microthyrium microscopicum TaxID=703497 RepID=A0A6A6UF45_9PEZI|nr:GCS-domain-containing protein [Microthyrium microscopicum]
MGLLALGTPLEWSEVKKVAPQVRQWGIEQLLMIWKGARGKERDAMLWGDEVEYLVVCKDDAAKKMRLSLRQADILAALEANAKIVNGVIDDVPPIFHPEFGRFMLEATPGKPWGIGFKDLLDVEHNMRLRRIIAKEHMAETEYPVTLTTFPRIGCEDTTVPAYPLSGPKLRSQFLPDEIANPHIRFPTLAANIRSRRGRKVALNVPIFYDEKTPKPFKDPLVNYDLQQWPEDADVRNGAAKEGHVYMDAMAFGMGSCCLQMTFQAKNIDEGRKMYDQLSPLGPILLALTAATPIYKGFLVDTDVRWNQISGAVDDRTPEELGETPLKNDRWRIPKSRYAANSTYISQDPRLRPEYLDPGLIIDPDIKQRLMEGGMDDLLATHFAHLFIRDPIVVFAENLKELDLNGADHFENLQSTNWQHMRFKPPPPGSDMGWRVEFRPMEIQVTDRENAAFAVFLVLITRAILSFDLNFYIPIARVTENMETAHARDAVRSKKFWFRKDVFHHTDASTGPVEEEYTEMTCNEIMNGDGEHFPGLIPLVESYLSSMNIDVVTRCALADYLSLVRSRANLKVKTPAQLIRDFVMTHAAYKHDSVVSDEIQYDLIEETIRLVEKDLKATLPGSGSTKVLPDSLGSSWSQNNISQLAGSDSAEDLNDPSSQLYTEAIARQRRSPTRNSNDDAVVRTSLELLKASAMPITTRRGVPASVVERANARQAGMRELKGQPSRRSQRVAGSENSKQPVLRNGRRTRNSLRTVSEQPETEELEEEYEEEEILQEEITPRRKPGRPRKSSVASPEVVITPRRGRGRPNSAVTSPVIQKIVQKESVQIVVSKRSRRGQAADLVSLPMEKPKRARVIEETEAESEDERPAKRRRSPQKRDRRVTIPETPKHDEFEIPESEDEDEDQEVEVDDDEEAPKSNKIEEELPYGSDHQQMSNQDNEEDLFVAGDNAEEEAEEDAEDRPVNSVEGASDESDAEVDVEDDDDEAQNGDNGDDGLPEFHYLNFISDSVFSNLQPITDFLDAARTYHKLLHDTGFNKTGSLTQDLQLLSNKITAVADVLDNIGALDRDVEATSTDFDSLQRRIYKLHDVIADKEVSFGKSAGKAYGQGLFAMVCVYARGLHLHTGMDTRNEKIMSLKMLRSLAKEYYALHVKLKASKIHTRSKLGIFQKAFGFNRLISEVDAVVKKDLKALDDEDEAKIRSESITQEQNRQLRLRQQQEEEQRKQVAQATQIVESMAQNKHRRLAMYAKKARLRNLWMARREQESDPVAKVKTFGFQRVEKYWEDLQQGRITNQGEMYDIQKAGWTKAEMDCLIDAVKFYLTTAPTDPAPMTADDVLRWKRQMWKSVFEENCGRYGILNTRRVDDLLLMTKLLRNFEIYNARKEGKELETWWSEIPDLELCDMFPQHVRDIDGIK